MNTNNNRREVGPPQASAVGPLQTAAANLGGRGDLTMRETDPRGAPDRMRVLIVDLALTSRCTLDAPQHIATQLATHTRVTDSFSICNRRQ
jgi:hypothetical protein